nr:MAG TPA: hypothetical protein [Caudoviricetes sp.]
MLTTLKLVKAMSESDKRLASTIKNSNDIRIYR